MSLLIACERPRPRPTTPQAETQTVPEPPAVKITPQRETETPAQQSSGGVASPEKNDPESKLNPSDLAREFRAAAEPQRRGELAGDLWEIGTPAAVETLRQLYVGERVTDVKVDILSGVGEAIQPELRNGCYALLLAALTPGEPVEVRALAAHFLTESEDPRAIALLQQFAQDGDPQVREAAQEAMEARREKQAR